MKNLIKISKEIIFFLKRAGEIRRIIMQTGHQSPFQEYKFSENK
jgi:hypothetical protein